MFAPPKLEAFNRPTAFKAVEQYFCRGPELQHRLEVQLKELKKGTLWQAAEALAPDADISPEGLDCLLHNWLGAMGAGYFPHIDAEKMADAIRMGAIDAMQDAADYDLPITLLLMVRDDVPDTYFRFTHGVVPGEVVVITMVVPKPDQPGLQQSKHHVRSAHA